MPVMQKVQRFPFSCRMQARKEMQKCRSADYSSYQYPAAAEEIFRENCLPKKCMTGKRYGEAARRAMEAGVDAVEIHMAHGYLVSTFMSPRTNKRVDEFGGCFENRMRFSRLIIEEVKKQNRRKNRCSGENQLR